MTNTSPFIEDETIPDLRSRIAERRVDWAALPRAGVSEDAESFIRRLLDPRPDCRMTLDAARTHEWLQSVAPGQGRPLTQSPSVESVLQGDESMIDNEQEPEYESAVPGLDGEVVSQGFEQMQLHQDGTPTPTTGKNLQREGSRPLVRRSLVLSQAAEKEGGGGILEPSEQMISNSQAQDLFDENNAAAGPSTRKRKEPPAERSLEVMPEGQEWTTANAPVTDGANGRKKGKADDESSAPRSVRGTRAKGAGGASSDEEPVPKVRRSSRQTPQKPMRK